MSENNRHAEEFQSSHILLLVSYSILSVVLIAESILMSWELWVIPLAAVCMLFCWYVHITQKLTDEYRLWIYALFMMVSFFFYGIHETSTYDLAAVMSVAILLCTLTGERKLIYMCQGTYYITITYDLSSIAGQGHIFDKLEISRIMLHLLIVFIVGWIARAIIKKWFSIIRISDSDIKKLEDATQRMDDFLANVSHEIRTPINAVIGLTSVMLKKEKNEKKKTDIKSISDAGYRVSHQISDILDYTEIDMDKLAISDETYMLSSLINDLVHGVSAFKRPELELIIDVDANVPSVLTGDAGKIKKILWHLIINGLKYTREGGVYVRIKSVVHSYGINLGIEVRDTGIGMSDEEVDHVFEKFYQSNSGRARTAGGLGIGMSIVQGFVYSMGGFLTVESEIGVGTTVTVSIPQKVVDNTGCMSVANSRELCVAGYFHFDKFDNPQVREYYKTMISNLAKGLNVPFYRADTVDYVKKLVKNYRITHFLVGEEEYMADRDYIESLTSQFIVSIVANEEFEPMNNSGVKVIRKPFYCFPVITIFNMDINKHSADEVNEQIYFPNLRALVVDDEPMNLIVAEGIFKNYGMVVSSVNSGPESIAACEKENYDVIFMDHMMPDMDGIEAMKRIRSVMSRKSGARDYYIIALTANAVSSAKEMFLSEGFDGFVPKPIELSELERVLKHVLPKNVVAYRPVDESGYEQDDAGEDIQTAVTDNELQDDVDDVMAQLEKNGVRTERGLKYCQKDREFYKTLLIEYGQHSAKKLDDLQSFYEDDDWENYSIRVHAIKSTSKMIGADELSDIAKILENAAKEENTEEIDRYHADMMGRYKAILKVIDDNYGISENDDVSGHMSEDKKEDDSDIMEFVPETDEILEFAPEEDDEVLEFNPEDD